MGGERKFTQMWKNSGCFLLTRRNNSIVYEFLADAESGFSSQCNFMQKIFSQGGETWSEGNCQRCVRPPRADISHFNFP